MRKYFSFILLFLTYGACSQRPVVDLTLADVALKAAQKVRADSLAPDQYRQAENFYLRAKKDFAEGYFDSCKKYANQARLLAEQAEYHSLLKQNQVKTKTGISEEGRAPLPAGVPSYSNGGQAPPPPGTQDYQNNPNSYPAPEGPE